MQNMSVKKAKTQRCALGIFDRRNLAMNDDFEFIVEKLCKSVKLVNVNGLTRFAAFGAIKCFEKTVLIYDWHSKGKFSEFTMVNARCESDFTCAEDIDVLTLDHVDVISTFVMCFKGTCGSILLSCCTGTIDLRQINKESNIRCSYLITMDFFTRLPVVIRSLIIEHITINHNIEITNKIYSLEINEVAVNNPFSLTLCEECDEIIIKKSSGRIDLFKKLHLMIYSRERKYQKFTLKKITTLNHMILS
ncbi:putative LRR containing protein [Trachipleistophora hominis]|uniref:Putative LRR containing protein n=1 Tax=Trachipleistophora hominis TaxID=72359 RepID=L7JWS0_TRAHO|nr:putative LRR containing protein [Trachipleistophora hominis]